MYIHVSYAAKAFRPEYQSNINVIAWEIVPIETKFIK